MKNGRKRGSKLGFPTINLSVPPAVKGNHWGVYFSLVKIGDNLYPAITNLGPAKTFSLGRARCESHLLTIKKDLYNKKVSVKLLLKLREIEKFPHVKALKKQIKKDIKAAKKFFGI